MTPATPQLERDLNQRCIDTLRTLDIDQVQEANSGHPGMPMGVAPTAYCQWQRSLRFDPEDAAWPDRTREGLAVSMADLQRFRQAGSRCTGHPEHRWTTGVETTTGPLAQGLATQSLPTLDRSPLCQRPGYRTRRLRAGRRRRWPAGRAAVSEAHRERVLPEALRARVSVEAASALGWDRYVGRHGEILAMHSFGLSAPGKAAGGHFGFDVAHVLTAARRQLNRHGAGGLA